MAVILYPSDPLKPRGVDPHFAGEAAAVRELSGTVARIDHDALMAGDTAAAVRAVTADAGPGWYRGWMVPPARYAELADALAARGTSLRTTPAAYRTAHELPGWYPVLAPVTPASVWLPAEAGQAPPAAALAEVVAPLGGGPGIVKDFVKSRKHEWTEACFVPDLADTARLCEIVERLVDLQGECLAGGIVVRRFEEFIGGEARVWWVDGRAVLDGPHPDTPDQHHPVPDLDAIAPLVGELGCRFVSTDVVRHADGRWRVVEVGDGQVSDLPRDLDPTPLLTALLRSAPRNPVTAGGPERSRREPGSPRRPGR